MSIKVGTWVRAIRDDDNCYSPSRFSYIFNNYPMDRLKSGERFRVEEVTGNRVSYRDGSDGLTSHTPIDNVEIDPNQSRLGLKSKAVLATATTSAGVYALQHLNDPAARQTIIVLGQVMAVIVAINAGWWTVGNVAKGFGRMGDRRRRIRADKEEKEAAKEKQRVADYAAMKKEQHEAETARIKALTEQKEAEAKVEQDRIATAIREAIQAATVALPTRMLRMEEVAERLKPEMPWTPKTGDIVQVIGTRGIKDSTPRVGTKTLEVGDFCRLDSDIVGNSGEVSILGGSYIHRDDVRFIGRPLA